MVAHKTCEVARQTLRGRRLDATVHLDGLRCDGTAHGGCEAKCNIYWKDAWLSAVHEHYAEPGPGAAKEVSALKGDVDTSRLSTSTRVSGQDVGTEDRYSCQATRLFDATKPLAWWNPVQYVRDIASRNHSAGQVLRVLFLFVCTKAVQHAPFGYRLLSALRFRVHRWFMGREVPDFQGAIALDQRTPEGRLGLRPGEFVRVRSKEEIAATLNTKRKNRGMYFDVEMTRYCGRVARVQSRVTKLVDEATGNMIEMQNPCIILEGVVCRGEYSSCRLMCPRAIYPYWREIWLERIEAPASKGTDG
jgi:hypothetical protein